jgi:uncharacterized protein YecE (DUF72 family)
MSNVRIGTAGWSVPAAHRLQPPVQSHLEQYSRHFDAVEINSSFYRPHRLATYQRWRAAVPPAFRFSVKMPKVITHERRLERCADDLNVFLKSVAGLAEKLGVLLVQLPSSLAFDSSAARKFMQLLKKETPATIAWEPRNPGWFSAEAEDLFERFDITRVSAHPVPSHCSDSVPRHNGFAYFRLHGAPRMYYSSYTAEFLENIRAQIARCGRGETWCIFDNTAQGAAWPNAQSLRESISVPTSSAFMPALSRC